MKMDYLERFWFVCLLQSDLVKLKQLQDTIRGKKCELQVKGIIGELSALYNYS